MSRRGRGFWGGSNNTHDRPPGLRGRAIGMYYRSLSLRGRPKEKRDKETIIHFSIPPAIISSLQDNMKSIMKTAKECNIEVPLFVKTKFVKKMENDFQSDCLRPDSSSMNKHIRFDSNEPSTSKHDIHDSDLEIAKPIENQEVTPILDTSMEDVFKKPEPKITKTIPAFTEDFIKISTDPITNVVGDRTLSLRGAGDYKYGYEDITTGTFDEKLNECLANGIAITQRNSETADLNVALYEDYLNMQASIGFKKMKVFREKLPAYKKSKDLLDVIENNQVIVISGETGCGKSTQVPQIILDDAIVKKKGANIKILVTQPRRIAASSLAMRVAQERGERMGASVGYAIRLEKVDCRDRGSITFCTTGILLGDLEVNQGLTNYSHIILDEVHERDCHIDISMFMLKKVLQKRKDLKLILMSATVDADVLTAYFNNCPLMHIEGLAYPVQDIYLEDILQMTKFKLLEARPPAKFNKPWMKHVNKQNAAGQLEKEIQYNAEIGPWLESIKKKIDREVYETLRDHRIEDLNINLLCELLIHICKGDPGAILVFLPGITDIKKLITLMKESKRFPDSSFEIYPLHSKLPSLEQHKIFERPADHIRKIVVATNIAETSITIDDIVYVIDCGKIKYSGLNIADNISTLKTEWIAKANLKQRRGRAGRCQPGFCYHLLTSFRAEALEERLLPELQRNSLLEPLLTIKRLRLGKVADALNIMPSPPDERTVQCAITHLQQIGAFDLTEKLTPLGWHLARLPVDPRAGKLLILGALFGCLDRAASVAAVWGFRDPFQMVIGSEREVDLAKRQLTLGSPSDHVAISEAIIQWERCYSYPEKRGFAYENFLAMSTLELLSDMKKQLGDALKNMGFLPNGDVRSSWENRNSHNLSLFKTIVAASLYPNIATVRWTNSRNKGKVVRVKAYTPEDGRVVIHPSSVMASKPPSSHHGMLGPVCVCRKARWLVYWLKQRSTDIFLFDVTLVYTLPLLFFGELEIFDAPDPADCYIAVSTVKVYCKKSTAELILQMRAWLDKVLASKIGLSSTQSLRHNPFEELVLNSVKELITAEDESAEYLGESDSSEDNHHSNRRRRY